MNTNRKESNVFELVDTTGNPARGDLWQVRKNGVVIFEGKFKSVVMYGANGIGLNLADIERAIQSLCYNSHDILTFDHKGNLIHTSKRMQKTG